MDAYRRRGVPRCATAWLTVVLATAILCLPLIGEAGVPNPTIAGPIPATVTPGGPVTRLPVVATDVDLAQYGYVEQEADGNTCVGHLGAL